MSNSNFKISRRCGLIFIVGLSLLVLLANLNSFEPFPLSNEEFKHVLKNAGESYGLEIVSLESGRVEPTKAPLVIRWLSFFQFRKSPSSIYVHPSGAAISLPTASEYTLRKGAQIYIVETHAIDDKIARVVIRVAKQDEIVLHLTAKLKERIRKITVVCSESGK